MPTPRKRRRRASRSMAARWQSLPEPGTVGPFPPARAAVAGVTDQRECPQARASGLLVETDLVLDVGVEGVLENHLVHGKTQVRVVRHTVTPRGRRAMGLEMVWTVAPASDGSGLFRVG